jgi:hypothetical protein
VPQLLTAQALFARIRALDNFVILSAANGRNGPQELHRAILGPAIGSVMATVANKPRKCWGLHATSQSQPCAFWANVSVVRLVRTAFAQSRLGAMENVAL